MEMRWKLGVCRAITYLWLARNEGMEKKMDTLAFRVQDLGGI